MPRFTRSKTRVAAVNNKIANRPIGGGILATQNIIGGQAAAQDGAAEYSFSNRRMHASNPVTTPQLPPNAPDKVAAQVFGTKADFTGFGDDKFDNTFAIADHLDHYGPQGNNTMSDQHFTMLGDFAKMVAKGGTTYGGGAAKVIEGIMKQNISSHAAKSATEKETTAVGVPVASGGVTSGYNPMEVYAVTSSAGEPASAAPAVTPPSMNSPLQQSFTESNVKADNKVEEEEAEKPDSGGESVVPAEAMGSPLQQQAAAELSESDGAPPATATPPPAVNPVKAFLSSPAGRNAFFTFMRSGAYDAGRA